MEEKKGYFMTLYVKKNETEEEAQKHPEMFAINCLAQIIAQQEKRIAYFEKLFLGKESKPMLNIIYVDDYDKSEVE